MQPVPTNVQKQSNLLAILQKKKSFNL